MPKKDRPAPLPDSIFKAKSEKIVPTRGLGCQDESVLANLPEEVPVHNTFIQFGDRSAGLKPEKQLSTAPAWIGPSFQSLLQSAVQPGGPSALDAGDDGGTELPGNVNEKEAPSWSSPKKVPLIRYSLSASSARAVGVPTANAVVASYAQFGDDEDTDSGDTQKPSALKLVNLDDLPSIGSEKHDEGLCKRCCFFPKGRCLNGRSCEFCHFPHEKRKRKKKKKKSGAEKELSEDGSEGEDEDDEETPSERTRGRSTSGPFTLAAGGGCAPCSSDSEAQPPAEKRHGVHLEGLSTSPPSSATLSGSQLSSQDSPASRLFTVCESIPPKEESGSMPSTASSVPNWPRPPCEWDALYPCPPATPLAWSSPPTDSTSAAAAAALARGLPPPPPLAAPTVSGPAGEVDPRLPLYPAPFAGFSFSAASSPQAGGPHSPPAAPPHSGSRPPPR